MEGKMRHAYLIMAHKEPYNLKKLLELLDDEDNDIYIHIDIKSNILHKEEIMKWCVKSRIHFVKQTSVRWAGYSGIQCELILLEEAVNGNYDYYHLLSGQDLPLVSQKEIHTFFENNKGKEFVSLYDRKELDWRINALYDRVAYYHMEELEYRFKSNAMRKVVIFMSRVFLKVQKILHIRRNISMEDIVFGKNWFSITNGFAHYVLEHKEHIRKVFNYTASGDEMFLQYMLVNSPYKDNNYICDRDSSLRYVDWTRSANKANPHIWEASEFDELVNCRYLFARKFDSTVDKQIIDKIFDHVNKMADNA